MPTSGNFYNTYEPIVIVLSSSFGDSSWTHMHVCIPMYVGGVRVKSRVVKNLAKKTNLRSRRLVIIFLREFHRNLNLSYDV